MLLTTIISEMIETISDAMLVMAEQKAKSPSYVTTASPPSVRRRRKNPQAAASFHLVSA